MAEQSNQIFSYLLLYGRAEQTMWGINRDTKTIDLMHLESRPIKSFSYGRKHETKENHINESRAIKYLSHMAEQTLLMFLSCETIKPLHTPHPMHVESMKRNERKP